MLKHLSPPRFISIFLCLLGALGGLAPFVFAQDSDELRLSIRRDWGYGGGDQIQGYFTLEALGPENLTAATFTIDDQVIGVVNTPPFKLQINTDAYPRGWHELAVIAATADGRTLTSASHRFEFVSAEAGWQAAQNIFSRVGLLIGGLLVVMLATQFLPSLLGKKKAPLPLGATRNYGLKGGAICPKCQRPFSVHLMSFNFGPRYYDYCDHCGKWSLVRRATSEELRAAEQAELQLAQPQTPVAEESPEEKLKRQIDASRYVDG